MTRAFPRAQCRKGAGRRGWRAGFSLVEVVVATGLCTYALVIIACLLPMGLGTVQSADAQVSESEMFNRIWLEVQTVPFYNLPNFQRFSGGKYPDATSNATGLSYFDKDGGEIGGLTKTTTTPPTAVYFVYCSLIYPNSPNQPTNINGLSTLNSRLSTLGPPVDGLGLYSGSGQTSLSTTSANSGSMGAGLVFVRIDIGFHLDPSTLTSGKPTDTRVTSRTYLVSKRDTQNGS